MILKEIREEGGVVELPFMQEDPWNKQSSAWGWTIRGLGAGVKELKDR